MHYTNERTFKATTRDVAGQNLKADQVLKAMRHASGTAPRIPIPSSHHPAVMRSAKGGRS